MSGLDEADLDVLGGNRHRGGALPQPVSGYHPEQPVASLNFPGSECCFLRMFMPPSSLPLWNVLLSSVCVCVCEMVVTIILYSSGLAGSTGREKNKIGTEQSLQQGTFPGVKTQFISATEN